MNKNMIIIFIGLVVILIGIISMSFFIEGKNKNTDIIIKQKEYDRSQMWTFITKEQLIKQYQPDIDAQYKICAPLRPERFRRRMKMLLGIDINGYPKDASLVIHTFGAPYLINLKTQIFSIYDPNTEYDIQENSVISKESPYADWESEKGPDDIFIRPSDKIYSIFRKFTLINDLSCMEDLIDYRIKKMDSLKSDPKNDEAFSFFGGSIETAIDFIHNLYCRALFILDIKIIDYVASTEIDGVPYSLMDENKRTPDIRQDMIWLYTSHKKTSDLFNRFYYGYSIETKINKILSTPTEVSPNVWGNKYNASRSATSLLSFILRLKNKEHNKFIIQFMSGQLDYYMRDKGKSAGGYMIDCKKVRENMKTNNYYGYAVLREFCENPMREMPTLEKIGTNFPAKVKEANTLLLLEPFADSYDIDTIQPTETLKAYEMGHDDYYFVEVVKPVESPLADKDGFAMIVDRTETVYGYLPKTKVKAYTSQEVLQESQYTDKTKSKRGVITDKDGYVNIRKEPNAQSEIIGKIEDKEIFHYWQTSDNWYIVETTDGKRGYVYKDRIREKHDTGGWTLDE